MCQVCRDVLVRTLLDPLSQVSPVSLCTLLAPINSLTSLLKGRSGFAQLLLGLGCLVAVSVVTSDFEPK